MNAIQTNAGVASIGRRDGRRLSSVTEYVIQLYFELQYVSRDTADLIETADRSHPIVSHLCNSLEQQILGDIVADSLHDLNSSISIEESNDNCRIVGTSRRYDADAENIFGREFLSLQVHIAQRVSITSNHFLWHEEITSIIECGFEVQTGGQSEFRQRLQENDLFRSVLIIDLRRGLSESEEPPSPAPTRRPTRRPTRPPTHSPTRSPSVEPTPWPSPNPTNIPSEIPSANPTTQPSALPSANPTKDPSMAPSNSPSNYPSTAPSLSPSTQPSLAPSTQPSLAPSGNPSILPTTSAPITDSLGVRASGSPDSGLGTNGSTQAVNSASGDTGFQHETVIIAMLAGGMATVCAACFFMLCFWWRNGREKNNRRKPKVALTSRDGQQKHDHSIIPGVVELDQQSLADTTLGEQTAGRRVHITPKKRPSPGVIPLGSFDEQSLYTTPFSVRPDELSSYVHAASPATSASTLSDQITRIFEYEGNNLLPVSDTNTESSDGIYSSGQASERGRRALVSNGPIDLDTHKPFDIEDWKTDGPIDLDTESPFKSHEKNRVLTPTNNETLARKISKDLEEGDVELDPHDIDEWSCEFQDFDRGSDFYDAEAISRSTSQSSSSISRLNKIGSVLGDSTEADEVSQTSAWNVEEEKKDIEEEIFEEKEPFAKLRFDSIQQGQAGNHGSLTDDEIDKNAALLYKKLMSDERTIRKSTSPNSLSTKKLSNHSGTSLTSLSSFDSRKIQIGQHPLYQNLDSKLGPLSTPDEEHDSSFFPVTLSKLFNSVASPDTKGNAQNGERAMSIPNGNDDGSSATDLGKATEVKSRGDDESLLHGTTQTKDDVSASSASTGMSPNPWLFDAVEQTLGPRSVTADMDSLSGKSNLSALSPKGSTIGHGSVISHGSRISYRSRKAKSDASHGPRREVEHNLKRLEMQLAALDSQAAAAAATANSACGGSSITGGSLSTLSTRNRSARVSRKKRIIVLVPPGRLGVILTNRHDGRGTVVSEVKYESPLRGMLSPGDRLVAVDGEDVTRMVVSQITSLMASRAERERRLTVITKVSQQYRKASESKK